MLKTAEVLVLQKWPRAIEAGEENRANGKLANHVLEIMHAFHESSSSKKYYDLSTSCKRPEPLPMGLIKGEVRK